MASELVDVLGPVLVVLRRAAGWIALVLGAVSVACIILRATALLPVADLALLAAMAGSLFCYAVWLKIEQVERTLNRGRPVVPWYLALTAVLVTGWILLAVDHRDGPLGETLHAPIGMLASVAQSAPWIPWYLFVLIAVVPLYIGPATLVVWIASIGPGALHARPTESGDRAGSAVVAGDASPIDPLEDTIEGNGGQLADRIARRFQHPADTTGPIESEESASS